MNKETAQKAAQDLRDRLTAKDTEEANKAMREVQFLHPRVKDLVIAELVAELRFEYGIGVGEYTVAG